jgi:hypothetical protein
METGSLVTRLDGEISDSLASFAREAESALTGLFQSVKDSYGEKAALYVADEWLKALEVSLNSDGSKLPEVRDITAKSIKGFLASCTRRGRDAVLAASLDSRGLEATPTIAVSDAAKENDCVYKSSRSNDALSRRELFRG